MPERDHRDLVNERTDLLRGFLAAVLVLLVHLLTPAQWPRPGTTGSATPWEHMGIEADGYCEMVVIEAPDGGIGMIVVVDAAADLDQHR